MSSDANSIDVKQATAAAIQYFKDVYTSNTPANLRVEEVWVSDDEKKWHITLGYDSPSSSQNPLSVLQVPEREYKEFIVRTQDGKVVSMRIRKP
jgi:hypothetical protein